MIRLPLWIHLIGLFLFSISAVNAQVVKGEGEVKTDVRELTGFTGIIAQGRFELALVQGGPEGVRIESNENLLEFFQTRIEDSMLYISMTADIRKYSTLKVTVSVKELKKIYLLNEISLVSDRVIHFETLELFSGGMSRIDLELYASKLTLQLTDGTFASLKGFAEGMQAEIHDETELNAFELQVNKASILSSGFTEIMVHVKKELRLMVSGSSNVYYMGEPSIKERIFSSNGFIVKRKSD
ncbi:MAG: head GIN domain-containing protein [Salinivirgaceae bacterium]